MPEFSYAVNPDPVLLFRYSALTFNGHRIHYDQPFCIETEGYKGLVVHGPLLATLMLDLIRQNFPDAAVKYFQFRALAPVFDTMKFKVCGRQTSRQKWKFGSGVTMACWQCLVLRICRVHSFLNIAVDQVRWRGSHHRKRERKKLFACKNTDQFTYRELILCTTC